MDLYSYPRGENGRLEQILNQFFLKSLHMILDSRVSTIQTSSGYGEVKKSDKWFNLVLGDRPSAMDNLSFWNRSFMEPLIIDIILVQESPRSSSDHNSSTTLGSQMVKETVIERWVVQHEHQKAVAHPISEASYKKTYKKSILLLRSVYSMLRLLPAYKAFRKQGSSQNCDFDINYKICTHAVPFSREEDKLMKRHNFIPIDTQQGTLSVSLTYCQNLSDFNLNAFVCFPSEIITDYVGSPLTEPIRPFPATLSEKDFCATSIPVRGSQPASSSEFQRRHSWTSGIHRDVFSQKNQPGSPPLYRSPYKFSSSPTNIYSHKTQNQRSPAYQKAALDDLLSPPFSPSPSPSPPPHLSSGNPLHSRMHSETSLMSILHPMIGRSPRYLSPNLSDLNRHSLPPLSLRSIKNDLSSQESSSGIRSTRKSDPLRAGEPSPGLTNLGPRVSRDSKEDSGRFSGPSSGSSPRVGFSRSSSRLSFQDEFSDGDFTYPFIVDDVDPPDFEASQNLDGNNQSEDSSQASSIAKRSQDAAVGVLVHMLRRAPPLRPNSSSYISQSSTKAEVMGEVGVASEFFKPRDTTDALEELKAYKEMKDLILSKSATRISIKD